MDSSNLTGGSAADPSRDAGVDGATASDGGSGDGSGPRDGGGADAGSAYANAVLADGPIAYFPLEDSTGVRARDVVGGHDGVWEGKVDLTVAGAIGRGAFLDGETTRLVLPAGQFGFPGKAPYSIELWLRADTVDGVVRRIFDQGGSAGKGGYTLYFTNTFLLGSRTDSGGTDDGYAANTPPTTGSLRHYVLTYDGGAARLYRDGVSGEVASSLVSLPTVAGSRLVFGDMAGGQFFKLRGMLDEIAIYDRALTAAQVLSHFEAR